ncbi:MAG: hypothetical protein QMD36_03770 [Candidatus Aenigmarchaeota archaeon]|nr:hypothetical protein [Candidatus Aenigmarchaeota archaeon]
MYVEIKAKVEMYVNSFSDYSVLTPEIITGIDALSKLSLKVDFEKKTYSF